MKNLIASDKIYSKQSSIPNAGRGVYAKHLIKKGAVIEICPVIEIPNHDVTAVQQSFLVTYVFFFGKEKERLFLALGFGSLYNHSYAPNALYKIKSAEKAIEFIALRDIKEDDEITVNYKGENVKNNSPLWFEVETLIK